MCGREVAVQGSSVPQLAAVLFVLAAAGREMHTSELCEFTGYAPKSLSTVFTGSHELVERKAGALRLADDVWTDHAWATECVEAARRRDARRRRRPPTPPGGCSLRCDALQSLEQGPFAVLPAGTSAGAPAGRVGLGRRLPRRRPGSQCRRDRGRRGRPGVQRAVVGSPGNASGRACRPAGGRDVPPRATVPFAHVGRQLRESMWVSGAECLLLAAARVAGDDETLLGRVHQTARALAAREQLEASTALADELGL